MDGTFDFFPPLKGQSVSTPASQLHLKLPSLTLPRSQILAGAAEDPGLLVASPGLCATFVQNQLPSQDRVAGAGACSESTCDGQSGGITVSR